MYQQFLQSLDHYYPSVKEGDLVWLQQKKKSYLIIKGKDSWSDSDADVKRVETIEQVRVATVNTSFDNCKVFSWHELFGSISDILLITCNNPQ